MGDGFQPGGRTPAPPPLDLVQDFVNTEVPVWSQDDIATPDELAAWLRGRGLLGADDDVDAESFLKARAFRTLLRELAARNTDGDVNIRPGFRDRFAAVVADARLRFELDERGGLRLDCV